ERGAPRRHLTRIARLLGQGENLSDSIRRGFPDCPSLPLSLISAGEKTGQLTLALDQAENALVERARRTERIDISVWPFLLIVIAFMIMMVAGVMVAIVPKYKEIFKDFRVELPPFTRAVITVCDFVSDSGLLAV